jgi:ribosomal protein S18 acetylase RimI-like enzyme
MTDILTDLSPAALAEAIQENEVRFWLERARIAGWEVHEERGLAWYVSGMAGSMDNGVLRTHLTNEDADRRIEEMQAAFTERELPLVWWGGPARTPADLAARLEAHGFVSQGDDPGMAIDLRALVEDLPTPSGLTVERVADNQQLAEWIVTLRVANGGSVPQLPLSERSITLNRPDTYVADDPYRLYIARLDGKAVATVAVQLAAGVAGLYCVATVPDARRQGIGSAVVLAGLRDARADGYRVGVLGSSPMGYGVYRRLGFREYCTLQSHTWDPTDVEA